MKEIHDVCFELSGLLGIVAALRNETGDWAIESLSEKMSELTSGGELKIDIFSENVFGEKDAIHSIEQQIINIDDNGRKFIFKRIFGEYQELFYYAGEAYGIVEAIRNKCKDNKDLMGFCCCIEAAARFFTGYICIFCKDFGFEPEELANYEIAEEVQNYWIASRSKDNNEGKRPYKRMPRNQSIAALGVILEKAGVDRAVYSKAIMAEVVEALTGGNPAIQGKNTHSYKYLDDTLLSGTKALLKKNRDRLII